MQVLTPEERHQHQFSEVAILYHARFIDSIIFLALKRLIGTLVGKTIIMTPKRKCPMILSQLRNNCHETNFYV